MDINITQTVEKKVQGTLPSTSLDKYLIGRRHDEYESTFTFGGTIDEARIYNRALSADDVKMLYNYGRGGNLLSIL